MALTKPEKIKKLRALGVELSGDETVKDLDALLESYKEGPAETPMKELEEAGQVPNSVAKENGTKTRTVVRYINPETGLTDRVFSLADHGEDFQSLARQFSEKYDGRIDPE